MIFLYRDVETVWSSNFALCSVFPDVVSSCFHVDEKWTENHVTNCLILFQSNSLSSVCVRLSDISSLCMEIRHHPSTKMKNFAFLIEYQSGIPLASAAINHSAINQSVTQDHWSEVEASFVNSDRSTSRLMNRIQRELRIAVETEVKNSHRILKQRPHFLYFNQIVFWKLTRL